MHHATSGGLLSGVRSGFGIAVLPCIVADADPDLVRCVPPRSDHGAFFGCLPMSASATRPRVRAVIDFLYERLSRHIRQLETKRAAERDYSTVTLFARLRGWSTSVPLSTAT